MKYVSIGGVEVEILALSLKKYGNNATALVVDQQWGDDGEIENGIPASINIEPNSKALPDGAFFLKDYSEGVYLADGLRDNGLIEPVNATANTGYVSVQAYRLTEKGRKLLKN